MKRLPLILLLLGVTACGGGSGDDGGDDSPGVDAPGGNADAANVPAMITISGTATSRDIDGSDPVVGAAVEAYRNGNDSTPVATTTTDASGNYMLTITTNGQPVDGYVKATANGLVDTYLYPPYDLVADFSGASLNMVSDGTLGLLYTLCPGGESPSAATVAVLVTDATMTPVAGAEVTSNPESPADTCYNSGGLPSGSATSTDADGVAYLHNLPTGTVTVSATKAGSTFSSHDITARAGALTTTPIVP